jgi:anti-sigma B factor antagonist
MSAQVSEGSRNGGPHTITVAGELDLATVSTLEAAVIRAIESGSGPILIDLSPCSFIDSSVIATLLRAVERVDGDGSCVPLAVAATAQPLEILRLTAIDKRVPTFDSASAAQEQLAGSRD